MFALIVIVGVALIFVWSAIRDLRRRLLDLDGRTRESQSGIIPDLEKRIARLEAAMRSAPVPSRGEIPVLPSIETPAPATVEAPKAPTAVEAASTVEVPASPTPTAAPAPAVADSPAVAESPAPAPPAVIEAPGPEILEPAAASALPPPSPPAAPPSAPASAPEGQTWEVVVGASWLNKIGVLVFVIGVALLVGYSMTHVGPLGRVAMGFVLSAAMLAGGVVLERRQMYRTYAYGLIAGGWAGVYFTTFAMHAIPTARVIDSDLVGTIALLAVATGMISHSLSYRSQTVTALAYIVAFATLALSPLTAFSLFASVPLALSLLVVATRFRWSGVAILGTASTYGLFVLRTAVVSATTVPAPAVLPLVVLGIYWLMFEAGDVISSRPQNGAPVTPLGLFPLNAVGFTFAAALELPVDDPRTMSVFTAIASAGYLASAVIRARLLPRGDRETRGDLPFSTLHAAVMLAAAFALAAIELRFGGNVRRLAVLLEAEMIVIAGMLQSDRHIRRIGGIVLAVAVAHAGVGVATGVVDGPWRLAPATPIAVLAALACYLNRETLRSRTARATEIEHLYTWMAFFLIGAVFLREVSAPYRTLAGAAFSLVLLEAGLRRAAEYRYQAYVAGLAAILGVYTRNVILTGISPFDRLASPPSGAAAFVLPIVAALFVGAAYRIGRVASADRTGELRSAGRAAGGFATFVVAVLLWHVLPALAVGPAWALMACAFSWTGMTRRLAPARAAAYALTIAAGARSVGPLLVDAPVSTVDTIAMAIVIAALFVVAYCGRRAAIEAEAPQGLERFVAGLVGLGATVSLAIFKWRVLDPIAVAPAWALTSAIYILLGVRRDRTGQRWQGYGLAAVASMRSGGALLVRAPVTADLWSPIVVCAAIYFAAAAGRGTFAWVRGDGETTRDAAESAMLRLLPMAATALLATIEWRAFDPDLVGLAWAITAAALTAVGIMRRAGDLRWQAYALLAFAAARANAPILGGIAVSNTAIVSAALVIAIMHGVSLAVRGAIRAVPAGVRGPEHVVQLAIPVAGTLLLMALIANESRATLVTLGWGLQGLALMALGLVARERVLRLSSLAVLLICTLKLFLSDLRDLEPLARIVSFVVLGLVLLAVSWTYTRFQEQIKKLL